MDPEILKGSSNTETEHPENSGLSISFSLSE
jgi:hypothetical protein